MVKYDPAKKKSEVIMWHKTIIFSHKGQES
jgi:hypothetical protein